MKKSSLVELSQIADSSLKEEHLGITHFKESGDVYPHDSDGWPVDPGRVGCLGDQRDQGRLAGIKKPAHSGLLGLDQSLVQGGEPPTFF